MEKLQQLRHGILSHDLGPLWPGIDMAMLTLQIAEIAQIDLQGLQLPPADRGEGDLF
jgi:hypothetical protein